MTKNITLVNTMTIELLDEDRVMKKFGVRPDQIIDCQALVGDASDNIEIHQVGQKLVNWLNKYDS